MSPESPGETIRPVGGPADIKACVDIFFESMNELHARQNIPTEDPTDYAWLRDALEHCGSTDPGASVLAWNGDAPLAFATAYRREDFWFLSFLFVRPEAQARGLGRTLMAYLLPSNDERARLTLATMVQSFQPVSTGLYASYGIAPRVPLYMMKNLRRVDSLPELPAGLRPDPLALEHVDALSALDRTLFGYARPEEHLAWLDEPITGMVYLDPADSLVGYGYVDVDGRAGPVATEDELITAAILRDLHGRLDEPEKLEVPIFGSSGTLFRVLLDAGMRLDANVHPDIYCSTTPYRLDPGYVPYASFMP